MALFQEMIDEQGRLRVQTWSRDWRLPAATVRLLVLVTALFRDGGGGGGFRPWGRTGTLPVAPARRVGGSRPELVMAGGRYDCMGLGPRVNGGIVCFIFFPYFSQTMINDEICEPEHLPQILQNI
jgi:hypothetical protein